MVYQTLKSWHSLATNLEVRSLAQMSKSSNLLAPGSRLSTQFLIRCLPFAEFFLFIFALNVAMVSLFLSRTYGQHVVTCERFVGVTDWCEWLKGGATIQVLEVRERWRVVGRQHQVELRQVPCWQEWEGRWPICSHHFSFQDWGIFSYRPMKCLHNFFSMCIILGINSKRLFRV